jgi:hypothetical protein
MSILRKIFLDREEWWNLVPDQSIFASGGQTKGDILDLAARHEKGKWILTYFGSSKTVSIKMGKLTASNTVKGSWIDPSTGETISIGKFSNKGVQSFTTPDGWEDALLILEMA